MARGCSLSDRVRAALGRIVQKATRRGWKVAHDGECREIIKQCEAALAVEEKPASSLSPSDLANKCMRCATGMRREYRTVDMPAPYGGTGWWHWSPDAVRAASREKGAWFACAVQPPPP